jgi:large subunit ribosomal protein L5
MKHQTVKEKEKNAFEKMKAEFDYKNSLAAPKLVKIVINSGTGTGLKKDKNRNDAVTERMAKITGQKGTLRGAKQSIASFKIRKGDPIGIVTTLRGARMHLFLEKLLNVALPRTKDFRGINQKAVDSIGNLTIGIREHTIFPETADEDIKDVFGLSVTLVSSAKNKAEGLTFFGLLGVPFKKEDKK